MKTSEKKIGFIKETIRFNVQGSSIVGALRASSGKLNVFKFVSIDKEGNLLFWKAGYCDVAIGSEDVVNCKVVDAGRRGALSSDSKRWYGPVFELTLSNGETWCLTVNDFSVEQGYANEQMLPMGAIPVVDGWLTDMGLRDEHYNDNFCPEGYKPNIVKHYLGAKYSKDNFPKIDKVLKLRERFPENFNSDGSPKGSYVFDGSISTRYIKE